MSFILNTKESVNKSPLNNSVSKPMYTFPKSVRFETAHKRMSSTGTTLYTLPDVKSQRSTTLGYGTKYDFTKDQKNKAPYYNMKSDFGKDHHLPAYTFGIGRQYFEKVYCETSSYRDKTIPGVGAYTFNKTFGSESVKYSMVGKGNTKPLAARNKVPGPGEYNSISMNATGKYPKSSFRNATSVIWANNKEKRFKYEDQKNPGPGAYENQWLINGKGISFISKFKSNPAKTLSTRYTIAGSRSSTPGPGTYNTFSEFGQYGSKNTTKEKN